MLESQYLYPFIKPYKTAMLDVDDIHSIYIEECGNPNGVPILYIHGGPGLGCDETSRRYFDPKVYRIILFDQRGCGRSKPRDELTNNKTDLLVQDIEKIRVFLKVESWILFAGSWGSLLALLYGRSYPERVLAFILRGLFLGQEEDLQWLINGGMAKNFYPEKWQSFVNFIPYDERDNLLLAYYNRLTALDKKNAYQAARYWVNWQACCATLKPNKRLNEHVQAPEIALTTAKIESHYFINNCFIQGDDLHSIYNIKPNVACYLIHGRYDVMFPIKNSIKLNQYWPTSKLMIAEGSGHASFESEIIKNLVNVTNELGFVYGESIIN